MPEKVKIRNLKIWEKRHIIRLKSENVRISTNSFVPVTEILFTNGPNPPPYRGTPPSFILQWLHLNVNPLPGSLLAHQDTTEMISGFHFWFMVQSAGLSSAGPVCNYSITQLVLEETVLEKVLLTPLICNHPWIIWCVPTSLTSGRNLHVGNLLLLVSQFNECVFKTTTSIQVRIKSEISASEHRK